MDSNEIKGAARDVEGKLKDGFGGLTGDTSTQVDGKLDQAAGKIQAKYGETIDKVSAAASNAGEAAYAQSAKIGGAVNDTVHESPWLSIIGMAAIGYFASFLIHSPSSPFAPRPVYVPRRISRYF